MSSPKSALPPGIPYYPFLSPFFIKKLHFFQKLKELIDFKLVLLRMQYKTLNREQ